MGVFVIIWLQAIYFPVCAAVGITVNLVAIVILSRGKCGLSRCITHYLVGMAVADFLVVIFDVVLNWIVQIYFVDSFLQITPVCSLILTLMVTTTSASVWLTVTFTFDRFVAICCQKLKTKYCTQKTSAVVVGTVSVLSCFEALPWYFIYEPAYTIHNIPWYCVSKPSFDTSPLWTGFELLHLILTPCLPFVLILLLNALTVRSILVTSRVRMALRGISSGEIHKDPEMVNRRKSIILLFSLSGNFILLWMIYVVFNLYRRIAPDHYYSSYSYTKNSIESMGEMLLILSLCNNTFIYAITQTKFREELKNALNYPFKFILKSAKS
ncbi:probable G-protein coupled receptor 139 [Rhincodon typus]|uniref:probable G-protein coupled receptor 139 n=1 Tax=Rhincodon typus TaxID=259920 RepID=UPI002030B096|nr:probable G-protein coupled receptor 139 [Rhincodon typus]